MTTTRLVKHFINKIKKISIDDICFILVAFAIKDYRL